MVEFVKGDTHISKAVPPRFKDHTKLVCARHSRSGRKKYVKKHPERVRKVPSRKLEGQGCPASISFKTYYDTEEVKACYTAQHSHEIGLANLPFTRKGRKAATKGGKNTSDQRMDSSPPVAGPSSQPMSVPVPIQPAPMKQPSPPPPPPPQQMQPLAPVQQQLLAVHQHVAIPQPTQQSQQHQFHVANYGQVQQQQHQQQQPPQQHQVYQTYLGQMAQAPPQPPPQISSDHDRWERMSSLFTSIRETSRTFQYPIPSVNALESVLIRLYLETPVTQVPQQQMVLAPVPMGQHQQMAAAQLQQNTHMFMAHNQQVQQPHQIVQHNGHMARGQAQGQGSLDGSEMSGDD